MKIKKRIIRGYELPLYLLAFVITASWFISTDAYVNEQALHTFYLPFLRGLRVFEQFFLAGFNLLLETHDYPFPYGIYIFPLLFHIFGLSNLALQFPFVLCLLLLVLFAFGAFWAFDSSRNSIMFFGLIFSFPLFQVSLKSFSPHSWNVVFGFLFFVFFENFVKKGTKKHLFTSLLFGVLCISIKHLGIVIVSLYFFCRVFVALCFRKPYLSYLWFLFICLFLGGLFYPGAGLWHYAEVMFQHNQRFSLFDGLAVLACALLFGSLIVYWVRANTPVFSSGRLAGRFFFIALCLFIFIVYLLIIWRDGYEPLHFYAFLSVYFLAAVFSFRFIPFSTVGLYVFFYVTLGAGWFLFLFAFHVDFFVFPFLILFYLAVQEGLSRRCFIVLCLSGLFISNTANSHQEKSDNKGNISFFAQVEERIFNSFSWNPLSWKPMQMRRIKTEMEELLLPFLVENNSLIGLGAGMNFKAYQELSWPPYLNFVDGVMELGGERQFLAGLLKKGEEDFFLGLYQEKKIAIFIEAMPHWDQSNNYGQNFNLQDFVREFATYEELSPEWKAAFMAYTGERWIRFLRERDLLPAYNSYPIPADYPLLWLHIRKDLPFNQEFKNKEPVINIHSF